LRVEERTSGPPAVWLHPDGIHGSLSISEREIGRGLPINSITSWATSLLTLGVLMPWFEEALVEAFSLRGLALLANSWSTSPPFKDDSGFGAAVTVYRQNIVERYGIWRRWRPKCQSSGQGLGFKRRQSVYRAGRSLA
jgi:hypothetical protein